MVLADALSRSLLSIEEIVRLLRLGLFLQLVDSLAASAGTLELLKSLLADDTRRALVHYIVYVSQNLLTFQRMSNLTFQRESF